MDDIFFPLESEPNTPRGRRGSGSSSLRQDPPPEISITSDEATTPEVPSQPGDTPSDEDNPETSDFTGFPSSSEFWAFPYDPDPFPPFWVFKSPELPPSAAPRKDDSMEVEDLSRCASSSSIDGSTDGISAAADREEKEGEDEDGEDDWSLASSEQFEMVSNHQRDGHSTPSDFVLASVGTPSIPDDLMSFSSDQDETSSDDASSDEDQVVSADDNPLTVDQDQVSFYSDDGNRDSLKGFFSGFDLFNPFWKMGEDVQDTPAVRSKNLKLGQLVREDTLEEQTSGLEHSKSYDVNHNEECLTPLGDPLFSSLVFGVDEARTGADDIFHDTEDGNEDMETPRAPCSDHVFSVTGLHSFCSVSPTDPDLASRPGVCGGSNQACGDPPGATPSPESLQEESCFDSGNFQPVDDSYECYPTRFSTSKFDKLGSRFRKRESARECRGWW